MNGMKMMFWVEARLDFDRPILLCAFAAIGKENYPCSHFHFIFYCSNEKSCLALKNVNIVLIAMQSR